MIGIDVGKGHLDILPVVNGLVSEISRVKDAYGTYDAYSASMGLESLEALRCRTSLNPEDTEISDIDLVYSERLSVFGEIEVPSPAFCELVDLCAKDGKLVIPLDMNDDDFTTAYIENIGAFEFTNERRTAKKGMKVSLDSSSPEAMARDWNNFLKKKNKGYMKLCAKREKYIADQILDTMNYRNSLLAVIEVELSDRVADLVRNGSP